VLSHFERRSQGERRTESFILKSRKLRASSLFRIDTLCPVRSHPCAQDARTDTLSSAPASTSLGATSTVHVRSPCALTAFAVTLQPPQATGSCAALVPAM
jgi:hypothetical protein